MVALKITFLTELKLNNPQKRVSPKMMLKKLTDCPTPSKEEVKGGIKPKNPLKNRQPRPAAVVTKQITN